MSETADRYRRLSADLTRTLEAVPADRWDSPTPCPDWTARQLAEHLVQTQGTFLGFVELPPPGGPAVEEDLPGAWAAARDAVQAALDDPATADREFDGHSGRTTFAEAVDRFLCFDLVVHRWDLARAAGLDERLDPADLERVHAQAVGMGEVLRSPGAFGPEVPAPADADLQTRVLAFLGRRA